MSDFRLVAAVFDEAQSHVRRGAPLLDALQAGIHAVSSMPYYEKMRAQAAAQVIFDEAHIPVTAQASAPAAAEQSASAGGPAVAAAPGAETLADQPVPADPRAAHHAALRIEALTAALRERGMSEDEIAAAIAFSPDAAPAAPVRLLMSKALSDGSIVHVFSGNPPRTPAEHAHVDAMTAVANKTLAEHGRDGSNAGLEFTMTSAPDGQGIDNPAEPVRTERHVPDRYEVKVPQINADGTVEFVSAGEADTMAAAIALGEAAYENVDGEALVAALQSGALEKALAAAGIAPPDGHPLEDLLKAAVPVRTPSSVRDVLRALAGGDPDYSNPAGVSTKGYSTDGMDLAIPIDAAFMATLSEMLGREGRARADAAVDASIAERAAAAADAALTPFDAKRRLAFPTVDAEQAYDVARNASALKRLNSLRETLGMSVLSNSFELSKAGQDRILSGGVHDGLGNGDETPDVRHDRVLYHTRARAAAPAPAAPAKVTYISEPQRRMLNSYWAVNTGVLMHDTERLAGWKPAFSHRRILEALESGDSLPSLGPVLTNDPRGAVLPLLSSLRFADSSDDVTPLDVHVGAWPHVGALTVLQTSNTADAIEEAAAAEGFGLIEPIQFTLENVDTAAVRASFGIEEPASGPIEEPDLEADAAGYAAEEKGASDHEKAMCALNTARSLVGLDDLPEGGALGRIVVEDILAGHPFNRYGLPLRPDQATDAVGMLTSSPAWKAAMADAIEQFAAHEAAGSANDVIAALAVWARDGVGESLSPEGFGLSEFVARKQAEVDAIVAEHGSDRTFKVSAEMANSVLEMHLRETTARAEACATASMRFDEDGEFTTTITPASTVDSIAQEWVSAGGPFGTGPAEPALEPADARHASALVILNRARCRAGYGALPPEDSVLNEDTVDRILGGRPFDRFGFALCPGLEMDGVEALTSAPDWSSTLKPTDTDPAALRALADALPAAQAEGSVEGVRGDEHPGDAVLLVTGDAMVTLRLPAAVANVVLSDLEGAKVALSRAVLGGDLAKAARRVVEMGRGRDLPVPYWDDLEGIALEVINPIRARYGSLGALKALPADVVSNILSGLSFTLWGHDAPSSATDRCAAFTARPHVAALLRTISDLVKDLKHVRDGADFSGDAEGIARRRILNPIRERYGFDPIDRIEDALIVRRILSGDPFDRWGQHANVGNDAVSEFTSRPHVRGLLRVIADLYKAVFERPAPLKADMDGPGARAVALRELNQQRRESGVRLGSGRAPVEVIDLESLPDWADVEKLVIAAFKRGMTPAAAEAFYGAPFTGQAWVNAINDFLLQSDGTIAPAADLEGGAK